MKTLISATAAAAVLFSTSAPAASDLRAHVEKMVGGWTSDGDAFGGPAQSSMRWSMDLDGRFARLDYAIHPHDAPRPFRGVGYYELADDGATRGFWADNAGALHPIRAELEGDALIAHWGDADSGEQGRSRYELTPGGDIQVTDWVKTPEGWRQFNQNTFSRAEALE